MFLNVVFIILIWLSQKKINHSDIFLIRKNFLKNILHHIIKHTCRHANYFGYKESVFDIVLDVVF